eukprot:XP_021129713.2 protein FAM47A [Anas platyrhynchos]
MTENLSLPHRRRWTQSPSDPEPPCSDLPCRAARASGCGAAGMSAAPWYKEKLSSRVLPTHTKQRFSDSLNSQRWRFLKSGLDDFRSGFPPPCDNIIIQGTKGLSPVLLQSGSHLAQQKAQKTPAKPKCKLRSELEAGKEFTKETDRHPSHDPKLFHSHLEDGTLPEVKRT